MEREQEYLKMMQETSRIITKEKAAYLGETAAAVYGSANIVNEVEFWKWLGANYPKTLGNMELIQRTAIEKGQWLQTQLQGKGYEWDFMLKQRWNPSKILSVFQAGDCPTQPGIDITETGLLDSIPGNTYQNKAYLSSNNPDLHNTPTDAIVVTNKEKAAYARKKGYATEEFMDSKTIQSARDSRYEKALSGKVATDYTLKNIAATSVKAGMIGAAIGITAETISSYRRWSSGELTDQEYLKEVLNAGGEAGVTAGVTSAVMIPIQAAVTAAGLSGLITIPIAFVFGTAVNAVVAPCFGRGKYRKILNEAKYYQALEDVYDDFLDVIEMSGRQYEEYILQIGQQKNTYEKFKEENEELDRELVRLFESI